ncbi:MAG: AMP-binding protein [Burkholderiales bacterium]|nr:AMP-binding protein [Burkholderiales bacterium]
MDDGINAAHLLLQAAPPTRTALAWGERSLSYGELRLAAARAAWVWHDCGVQPGEPVLLRLHDRLDRAVALLGAIWAGAVPVPLVTGMPEKAWMAWAQHAGSRFVLDDTREGYDTAYRDNVMTVKEWQEALDEAQAIAPASLPSSAPACWTDFGGVQPAKVLEHGFVLHIPAVLKVDDTAQGGVHTQTTLGMLRALRRAATVVLP